MKFYLLLFLISLAFINSCRPFRQEVGLAQFIANGKTYNSLIENRIPQYGDGRRDGCIVQREIRLTLDSSRADLVQGEVTDTKNAEPLMNAEVLLSHQDGLLTRIQTDDMGKFNIKPTVNFSSIHVNQIGYRSLTARFKGKKPVPFNKS